MNNENNNLFVDEEDLTWIPTKEDRILGAVCYAHFFFVVPFLLQKDTDFLKFHMSQWWVLYLLFVIFTIVPSLILPFSWSFRLSSLMFLGYTFLWIFAWYKAYIWQKYEIKFLKILVDMIIKKLNEKK